MKILHGVVLSLLVSTANGAINVTVRGTTPTQAVISYTLSAPTGAACLVEISESPTYSPLVHDVDSTLFSGANKDNRSGAISSSGYHVFVAGTRGAAQVGADGKWYSRALAANTLHYARINNDGGCDSGGAVTFTFSTPPPPMGRLYNDPVPAGSGGTTAWPQITGRSAVIDPQTGVRIIPVTLPGDQPSSTGSAVAFQAPYDRTATWSCTSGTLPCSYSSTNQSRLFLPVQVNSQLQPSYQDVSHGFLAYLYPHVTGKLASGTATVDFCLTLDGVSCATNVQQQTFTATSSTYNIAGSTPGFSDWGPDVQLDHVRTAVKSGTVSVAGSTLSLTSGNHFVPPYSNGTPLLLSGTGCNGTYTMSGAASDTDSQVTLSSAPGCSSASFTLNAFGLLVWANSSSSTAITISGANFDFEVDYEAQEDSSPMQLFTNQTDGPQITVNGCPGYLAYHLDAWYWESAECQQVNYLGQWESPYSPGVNAATFIPYASATDYGSCVFNPAVAGSLTCLIPGFNNEAVLIQAAYSGNYQTVPEGTVLPVCTGSNQPCLTFTTLETSLVGKLRAYSAAFAADCCTTAPVLDGGCPDGTLLIRAPLAGQQGAAGWYTVYDPNALNFVAARNSTDWYPNTGNGFHSAMPRCAIVNGARRVGYGAQLGAIGTVNAPLSGTDSNPASGPYRLRIPAALSSTTTTCPPYPGSGQTPIAAQDWPGGSNNPGTQCSTVTLASGIWEDPSPYSTTLSVTATAGSSNVSTTSTFIRAYAGKPIVINGTTYTIQSYTDSSDFVLSPAFSGSSGTYTATLEAEPPCSATGLSCDNAADYGLRVVRSGDKVFVGQPTPGVSGYSTFFSVQSEAMMFLTGSGTTWTVQRGYGGHGVSAWSSPVYLYMDSGSFNFFVGDNVAGWDFFWDTTHDPSGSLGLDTIDYGDQSGHGFRGSAFWSIFDSSANSPLQTLWTGGPERATYRTRFGTGFSYATAPSTYSAMTAPFSCVPGVVTAGVCTPTTGLSIPNDVDTHLSWPYVSQPTWLLDGRVLDSGSDTLSTGSSVSGTLYKWNYSQRGFLSASAAIATDKVLPIMAFCGQHPMTNVSGPGASIDGTSANGYKYLTVVTANEGISGSSPGDLYVNCPGASVIGPSEPPVGFNGGDTIDINVYPQGPWVHGNIQLDFSEPSAYTGSRTRWLGHTLARYRWYNAFWNVRSTPDGLAMLSQVMGLDGDKSGTVMTLLPPLRGDSVNGADFVPVSLQLTPPSGQSIDNAVVEFGYAENGAVSSGLYCTTRQETCVKGSQSGNVFNYESSESGLYAGQPCITSCTVTLPAVSGRVLYYRVDFRSGLTVKSVGALDVTPVP